MYPLSRWYRPPNNGLHACGPQLCDLKQTARKPGRGGASGAPGPLMFEARHISGMGTYVALVRLSVDTLTSEHFVQPPGFKPTGSDQGYIYMAHPCTVQARGTGASINPLDMNRLCLTV